MKSRSWFVVSLLLVVAMLLGACAPKAPATAIKIAVIGPLTGANATFGAMNRDGGILALEEWNAKGGVLGRKFEWVLGDSGCDPKMGADAAKKAIDEDKVKYIVGAVCSSESIPIAQYANEMKVVQVSGTSTNPKVTVDDNGNVRPYTFRVCFIDPFQGKVMASFALNNLKAKTAAVVLDVGNDYIKGLAEYFKAAFEAGGGKVVVWESFVKEDTDFSAILAKVKDANPDVFFVPTYYDKVSLIGAQAKQKGIKATLLGGDGWDSSDLDRAAVDGGYYSNHYHPDDPGALAQAFRKSFEAKYGKTPDALAALGYDATNALVLGIKAAGKDDPTAVAKAIEALAFDAVSGHITFDKDHNPIKNAAILKVSGGNITFEASVAP